MNHALVRNTAYVAGRAKEIVGEHGSVTTETNQYNVAFTVCFSAEDEQRLRLRGSVTSIILRSTMLDDDKLDWVSRFITCDPDIVRITQYANP